MAGLFKGVDAMKVAQEIMEIGESATPRQIVDRARDESSELHKCFEWNDSIAAEKYRLSQARKIVEVLVIQRLPDAPKDAPEIRIFHKTESTGGYKPINRIVQDNDEYQKLLQRAFAEFHALKIKYQNLQELDYITSLIP
jgi:hypothetical protein